MTSTTPITEDRPLAWTTPDGRYTITVAATRFTYTVTVYSGTYRHDELCRTLGDEDQARMFARDIAKRLRDGASVAEVVAAIQPAADLIKATTDYLVLAADADKLSPAQRTAILAADPAGHIARRDVSTVKTLYALDGAKLGDLIRRGYTPTGLELNGRGMQIKRYLEANRQHIAA